MLAESAGRRVVAGPVAIGNLGDHLAALLEALEHAIHVKLTVQRRSDADLNVVVIDENRELQLFFHCLDYSARTD